MASASEIAEYFNIPQAVAAWRIVDVRQLTSGSNDIGYDVDFVKNPLYRIVGCFAASHPDGESSGFINPQIVVNGDRSASYNTDAVSFVDSGTPYQHQLDANKTSGKVGPGFLGVDFSSSEQVQFAIDLLKVPDGLLICSTCQTNGSGSGDIHHSVGHYATNDPITNIEMIGNITGFPALGQFAAGTRFELLVPNSRKIWADD